MKVISILSLSISVLNSQVVHGWAIKNADPIQKRAPIDPHLYIRDMEHDEVPSLDHILAIREATSHVSIHSTRVTAGMLLDHLLDTNPSFKPTTVHNVRKDLRFETYTFNESVWNDGVAEMLSRPPATTHVDLEGLENPAEPDGEDAPTRTYKTGTRVRRDVPEWMAAPTEALLAEFRWDESPFNLLAQPPNPPVRDLKRAGSNAQFFGQEPTIMARCYNAKNVVWAKVSLLREVADSYCTIFDVNMYQFAKGWEAKDVGEFSVGTIYHAVKMDGSRTMRVNFQFMYQPIGYAGGTWWYPMSIFTGIQGMCHKFMRNFLSLDTMPPDCKGRGIPVDTRGGIMGMDVGDKLDNRIVFRWSIQPYVRYSDQLNWPDRLPSEQDPNGLPRTDPTLIVQ